MELNKSDILVIGAGPGGYELAAEAASNGLSVTLIERDELGGTCLNRGCIPTKALCRSAEILELVRHSAEFGVNIDGITPEYAVAIHRKDEIVARLRDGVASILSNVNVVKGVARFEGPKLISVDDRHYTADIIVIATGSKSTRLPIVGAELAMTSDGVLDMACLTESMAVIGGGVIGLELAYILNAFGVKVTVLEYCKEILPMFDSDMAKRLRQLLIRKGIRFITSAKVTSIENGCKIGYEAKGKTETLDTDSVLMAVGRCPVYPEGLDVAGIEITSRGIKVDETMQTTVPGVYAIGDVNGLCQLAHAASAQGRIVLDNMLGRPKKLNLNIIPSAVFTIPELAMVGIGETGSDQAVSVYKAFYRANGKALAIGETDGMVKIVTDESGKLIGCQALGPHASDMVQEVAAAMAFGATLDDLKNIIHCHPTLNEILVSVR